MKVREVMQKGVVSVSPELPVSELEAFLTSEQISGAPVLDDMGRLPLGCSAKDSGIVGWAIGDRPKLVFLLGR